MNQFTEEGLENLKRFEGLRLEAYQDSAGVWTIGYGHTAQVQPGQHITAEQAEQFLRQDLEDAENLVRHGVTRPLNDNQYSALTSFAYNVGSDQFLSSTLLRLLNQGDLGGAAEQFSRWTHADGQELPGLVARRQAERALFLLNPTHDDQPLRLFAPPEQYKIFWTLESERERQLIAWIAQQLGLRYREQMDNHKLYLGLPASLNAPVVLQPLRQSNASSCGQTSVAMAINALTGQHLTDMDIQHRYGFALLQALNQECQGSGYRWLDLGDLTRDNWPQVARVLEQSLPVIIGLNGPEFSPSGRGHIITLTAIDQNHINYADPATGTMATTTLESLLSAPPHPDGKFIFLPDKVRSP